MGWKVFKDKFGIKHNIDSDGDFLLIGSGMVSNLVTVNVKTGKVAENSTFSGLILKNYPELQKASAQDILAALQQQDVFEKNIPIFSFDDNGIIEDLCEEPGYPNTTHQGRLIYENTFFLERNKAVASAMEELTLWISLQEREIVKTEEELLSRREKLAKSQADLVALENAYPEVKVATTS